VVHLRTALSPRPIVNRHIHCLSTESKDQVDALTLCRVPLGRVTVAAGDGGDPMYGHSLADSDPDPNRDGHVREVMHMEFAAASSG